MKHLPVMLVLLLLLTSLSGCLIRTRGRAHSHSRACPPSSHWNGNQCVHNGRGRGRGKAHRRGNGPTVRDHRR